MLEISVNERRDCIVNLLDFVVGDFKYNMNREFIKNWHHIAICEALERVFIGDTKRLIINLPPRYSKTQLAVIGFIAWSFGIYPQSEFMHVSYGQEVSDNNSRLIKDLMYSEYYKILFPETIISIDKNTERFWRTTSGGKFLSSGVGGAITSFGAGIMGSKEFSGAIVIDDPHKPMEVLTEIGRKKVVNWLNNTLLSRQNSRDTPIILIMQRLHDSDLTGYLMDLEGEEWETLILPALNTENEPLWPIKHNYDDLKKIERRDPYVFSGQYMQTPAPLGGGMFKNEWWQYYDNDNLPSSFDYKIITGDTAQKTKEHNDYSVFQCWGLHRNDIYLLDQLRGKWEAPELKKQLLDFYHLNNYDNNLKYIFIEDKASGTGLIQDIHYNEGIPITGVQRTRDKVSRAHDVVPYITSGYVHLPRNANYINEYIYEFSMFTPLMTHKHDDQIDATMDAIHELLIVKELTGTW